MQIRVMTSNIWGDYFGNPVYPRDEWLYDTYKKYSPDIIGFQEVTSSWYNSILFKGLSNKYMLVGSEMYNHHNFTPIAFLKDRFEILEFGWEEIKDAQDKDFDKSKSITYVVLSEKESKKIFGICNAHFWWKVGEEHDKLREKNALQLFECMKKIKQKYDCPVFALGDMNCKKSSSAFNVYREKNISLLFDLCKEKEDISSYHKDPQKGEDGLYHGEKTLDSSENSLDHIIGLEGEFSVKSYVVVTDQKALDATDHSPVYSDIIM